MRKKTGQLLAGILFLLALLMNVTWGWQGTNQQAKNEMKGDAGRFPVELLKLEKSADGEETTVPIVGAAFYLYKEDATQIGGRYVSDEEGKIKVDLPKGRYYFEEAEPAWDYTFDTEQGVAKTRYEFEVTGEETQVTVTAYNRHLQGALTIQKLVEMKDGTEIREDLSDQLFEFRVTFSDGGSYEYRINEGEAKILASGESLYLKHGEIAVFDKIPTGVLYTVEEVNAPLYESESSGHQGNITEEGCLARFVNRLEEKKGSLRVTKEARDLAEDLEFTFEIDLNGKKEQFTLKAGESKEFTDLPVGTIYRVTEVTDGTGETNGGDYLPVVGGYQGMIMGEERLELPFLNVAAEKGGNDLEITKEVSGDWEDDAREFVFEVTFEGEGAPESPQRFTLKSGEKKVFENLPDGVRYTVKEIDSKGLIGVWEEVNGVIAGGNRDPIQVTFVNKAPENGEEKGILRVRKEVSGEVPEEDAEKEFEITVIIDGKEETISLKAGEWKDFELPVGAHYVVKEADYYQDGYIQSVQGGTGTGNGTQNEAVVTNHYQKPVQVTIQGEKLWDLKGHEDQLPDFIRLQLKHGDRVVDEKQIKPDENGNWNYQFEVPKYDENGQEIEYTIEEIQMGNFKTEYGDGWIKNTYLEPIYVDPPLIRKAISGENYPIQHFEFLIEASSGTPMPEGTENHQKKVDIQGNGEAEIGRIYYEKPGEYIYTIRERNTQAPGWTYDASTYTMKITIKEENGKLTSEVSLMKDEKETAQIEFQNVYEEPKDGHIQIEGRKIWEDGGREGRPEEIIVQLYADDVLVHQQKVSQETEWWYSFQVEKYAEDGHEISYRIEEAEVAGYQSKKDGWNLINTWIGEDKGGTGNPDGSNGGTGAKTGDALQNGFWVWVMMLFIAVAGIVGAIMYRRRKDRNGE